MTSICAYLESCLTIIILTRDTDMLGTPLPSVGTFHAPTPEPSFDPRAFAPRPHISTACSISTGTGTARLLLLLLLLHTLHASNHCSSSNHHSHNNISTQILGAHHHAIQ